MSAERYERAMSYFAANGIDPSQDPALSAVPDMPPELTPGMLPELVPIPIPTPEEVGRDTAKWTHYAALRSEGVTTLPCAIDILGVLFYAHVEVVFTDPSGKAHTFEASAGGAGIGEIEGGGVIYYSDLAKLLATKAYGVTFIGDEGGTAMITWGSHGNANIIGIGEGLGIFGGSGSWK